MTRYERYKDSGIEWIGEIPAEWTVKKIKHTCYVKGRVGWKGLKSSEFLVDGYSYLITGTDFKNDKIDWRNCYHIDQERYDEDPYIQLQNDDLLITKDGTIGKLAVVKNLEKPACLNSGIFVVRSLVQNLSTRYLFWVLKSNLFSQFNEYTSYGSTIQHLYQNVFVEFSFTFPTFREQTAIADFLDRKTAELDRLIAHKARLIQLYDEERAAIINQAVTRGLDPTARTKPSGIDWLGDIPAHWEVKKIKFISKLQGGFAFKSDSFTERGIPIIRIGDIKSVIDWENCKKIPESLEIPDAFVLRKNDTLIALSGATTGKTAFISESPQLAYINQRVAKVGFMNKLLYFILSSSMIQRVIVLTAAGSAQENISNAQIENIEVALPMDEQEQTAIVNHIDTECARIDAITAKLRQQIDLFKEYRATLISEAVTGNIDARECAPGHAMIQEK